MPEEWRWWLGDRDSYLKARTEELESALYSSNAATSRLSSQLRRVQGTLEQRVDRLAAAFDAFIELSDLRTELNAFGDAFTARRLVREVVLDGIQPHDAKLVERLPDVPGYWLVPATRAVLPLAAGDQAAAERPLQEALGLDPERTTLFLAAALAVTDRPAAASRWLDDALGDLSGDSVTHAQRRLWLAASSGVFGDAGVRLVDERLRQAVDTLSEDRRAKLTAEWESRLRQLPVRTAVSVPRNLASGDALTAPLRAAATLGAVRRHCEEVLGGSPAPGDEPSDAPPSTGHPLAGLLAELVDEGSPDEAPVLQRVTELRAVIESNGQAGSTGTDATWHTAHDDPMVLLTADGLPTKGQPDPTLRLVAFRAATPVLRSVVEELATGAAQPVSGEATVSLGPGTVRLTGYGPQRADVTALEERLARRRASDRTRERVGYGMAGAGAVAAFVGIAAGPALVVIGLLVAAGALVYAVSERRRHRQALAGAEAERTAVLARLDEAQRAFQAFTESAAESRQQVDDDTAALRVLLQR